MPCATCRACAVISRSRCRRRSRGVGPGAALINAVSRPPPMHAARRSSSSTAMVTSSVAWRPSSPRSCSTASASSVTRARTEAVDFDTADERDTRPDAPQQSRRRRSFSRRRSRRLHYRRQWRRVGVPRGAICSADCFDRSAADPTQPAVRRQYRAPRTPPPPPE